MNGQLVFGSSWADQFYFKSSHGIDDPVSFSKICIQTEHISTLVQMIQHHELNLAEFSSSYSKFNKPILFGISGTDPSSHCCWLKTHYNWGNQSRLQDWLCYRLISFPNSQDYTGDFEEKRAVPSLSWELASRLSSSSHLHSLGCLPPKIAEVSLHSLQIAKSWGPECGAVAEATTPPQHPMLELLLPVPATPLLPPAPC